MNEELHIGSEDLRLCLPIIILDDGVVEGTENFFVMVEAQVVLDTISVATSITEICIIDDDGKEEAVAQYMYCRGGVNREFIIM